jgi:hypothetical protein
MTFVDTIMALSDRFLREQTFELVVAPAIADLQYDQHTSGGRHQLRNSAAVVSALAWGLYEEVTNDTSVLTFLMLVLIPACYYTGLILACAPDGAKLFSTTEQRLGISALIAALSFGPAIACYWPERRPRRESADRS